MLEFGHIKKVLVLYGDNGAGKTNILEAISLMSESNGLRRAKYDDMITTGTGEQSWNVAITVDGSEFSTCYAKSEGVGRRVHYVNGKAIRSLAEFAKENYVLWLTYETDRLFVQSPTGRRAFVDMMCAANNRAHTAHLRSYEKLARERLDILRKYRDCESNKNIATWLSAIENKLADFGLKVASERVRLASKLEETQLKNGEFPEFKNEMTGPLGSCIADLAAESLLGNYRDELKNRRQRDAITCMTSFGPNRSDWQVTHVQKRTAAALCSAGEQKMLLSGVFLAYVVNGLATDTRNLILLLDDVIAHLDVAHRRLLFDYLKMLTAKTPDKINVWLSGTDRALFADLEAEAEFWNVYSPIL
jgi:DNA replication and repair protein RecF